MLLALDVENSHTNLGAMDASGALRYRWRISTKARTTDELGMLLLQLLQHRGLGPDHIDGVCISCVAPSVRYTVEKACRRYLDCEPLVVGSGVRTGMRLRTDNPREVGADRIVNAVAAFDRCGGPVVVVGFNTATTFDCVSARGDYVGGAIAPGFSISADALFNQTAKLPRVEAERTERVIGTNTIESMQAGMFWGYVSLTDGLARRCKAELAGDGLAPKCIATGQMANFIGSTCQEIDLVDDALTLHGLSIIFELNNRRTGRR